MHNTAITLQLLGHFQMEITSCWSQRCLTIITCEWYQQWCIGCPFVAAVFIVFQPYLSAHSTLAPCSTSSRTTSTWPLKSALLRGVHPSLFALSNLAPCFSSYRTTSTWPFEATALRGFQPFLFALSNLAPCLNSSRTTYTWPTSAAKLRVAQPLITTFHFSVTF